MYCSGLLLSPNMFKGFKFEIMDVSYTEGDKVIALFAPRSCTTSRRCFEILSATW